MKTKKQNWSKLSNQPAGDVRVTGGSWTERRSPGYGVQSPNPPLVSFNLVLFPLNSSRDLTHSTTEECSLVCLCNMKSELYSQFGNMKNLNASPNLYTTYPKLSWSRGVKRFTSLNQRQLNRLFTAVCSRISTAPSGTSAFSCSLGFY